MGTEKSANAVIRLKPETRPKLNRIAKAKRWKIAEVVDALADDYLDREREQARREKQPAA